MTNIVNPTQFTITDPSASQDKVTGFNVKLGTKSGTYTITAAVPSKDLGGLASGQVTGPLSDLGQILVPGTYYAVATAISAGGESKPSAEFAFDVLQAPSAPTGFSVQ